MARGKRSKLEDLAGQPDPRAPLDGAAFLAAAQPVMEGLVADLSARAKGSAAVTEALRKRWSAEKQAQRTADGFGAWQERLCEQVAAAWLLSCVFVRTLEDRGLLGRARIAGEGAADGQRVFFELAPSLTERDYLLMVFRELSRLGAAAGLFDARHNPVWMLAPSAEGAKRLLELFRTPSVGEPAFRFGQEDTRFLGDLYQDLDEGVRKRFALLQTPRFVEGFILDRTLEVALEKFGVDDVEVIDPTCGSGHFLLGSFERLFERRLRAEPGLEVRAAASKALGAVYGADVNPYAVAIARFRLVLAFVEKGGGRRIGEVPRVEVNVVVADSLLHNPQLEQTTFAGLEGQSVRDWQGDEFALEDEEAARNVLHRRYAAVVGNPPYITVKDKVLRERYRGMYRSAAGKYSVAVPFTERFFHLARAGGRVGMITANSFMKREFGKTLIEEYLPSVNLDLVVNTSGAYIPGHGTPTVLLFGSNEEPRGEDVLTVLASRGEPSTPEDPEKGLVWSSVSEHWAEEGFENEYISVMRTEREALGKHPWSLAGGGATELKALIEERAAGTLGSLVASIGFMAITGEDDVFVRPRHAWLRSQAEQDWIQDFGIGEDIRDWSHATTVAAFFPYRDAALQGPSEYPMAERQLWPFRRTLHNRPDFGGKKYIDVGRPWYSYHQVPLDRLKTAYSIAFAFVATHNHFVLDRGGKVFKQSAPIIKLPETATEDDHLALLAYLNSSTACFWMKQVFFEKGATSDRGVLQADEDKFRYEFDGTKLKDLPLPEIATLRALAPLARTLTNAASATTESDYGLALDTTDVLEVWRRLDEKASAERRLCVALQEELDWRIYEAFHLTSDPSLRCPHPESIEGYEADERPFLTRALSALPDDIRRRRVDAIAGSRHLMMLEKSQFKRRWYRSQGKFNAEAVTTDTWKRSAYVQYTMSKIEGLVREPLQTLSAVLATMETNRGRLEPVHRSLCSPGGGWVEDLCALIETDSVPFLSTLRFTEAGLRKHEEWQAVWEVQRREDRGDTKKPPSPPPKYAQSDFASDAYYRLRGKLDVPKERFISYPHCESRESPSPLYGWAGWNHEQRARALATLYWSRKTEEGWLVPKPDDPPNTPDLTPMLAGLLELLPWLHQWHATPSDDYGGDSPASYFSAFLEGQCQELGLTHDDLRAWRPPARTRGRAPKPRRAKRTKKATASDPQPTPAPEPTPEPAFALTPPPTDDDGWKTTKKKSKKSSSKPRSTSRRKPSDPAQ